MASSAGTSIRVAVLGAGGLGRAACRIIGIKEELRLVAICDSKGLVASSEGLSCPLLAELAGSDVAAEYQLALNQTGGRARAGGLASPEPSRETTLSEEGGVAVVPEVVAQHVDDPLQAVMDRAAEFDAVLLTLPNMPNEFIPEVVARFAEAGRPLVIVDVLKRTPALERMFALDPIVKIARSVVLTGCGATPGLLSAAAVLAAQSFIEVERVEIWWGVGIANWEAYRATIREDIAHVPGYSVERAKAMSDEEVEAFLNRTNGILELHHMEHADDLLLERVGVVRDRAQVEVGGVMDTRHPKKPVSTTMTLTGITFEGKRASHRFILGDETTMAANVIGPALGYLKRGLWLQTHGIYGVFGSTDFLPMVVR